jgi:hypothetical protein
MSFFHVRDQSLELFIVLKPDKTCEIAERKLHNSTFQVPMFLMSVPAKTQNNTHDKNKCNHKQKTSESQSESMKQLPQS